MVQSASFLKKYPEIGACGLDCGLCPRYYTRGKSRCPGCAGQDFFRKHPSCSFITCCVKKNNFEVCGICPEFPCTKFKSDEEYKQSKVSSSYPPPGKIMENLNFIREYGIGKFIEGQTKRINLLKTMIKDFDDGRSRSFLCKATALLDISSIEGSLKKTREKIKSEGIKPGDTKTMSRILKGFLNEAASGKGTELIRS